MLEETLTLLSNIFTSSSPLYIVGGYVRDKLLNKPSYDVDLCSALTLTEVESLLKNTTFNIEIKNKAFGTARIYNSEVSFEYSTFRTDYYTLKNKAKHSPKKVEFVKDILTDYKRRDFTINAIYYDIANKKFIDLCSGKQDIENRVLKIVTLETFNYDGERILRLARFKTELNFNVEPQTYNLAKQHAINVLKLSSSTIEKFLTHTTKYNKTQKEEIKKFLISLNLLEIANKIQC